MIPIHIYVNEVQVELMSPIPKVVDYLDIQHMFPGMRVEIPHEHAILIADWLYQLSQKAGQITYNGTILRKEDINQWKPN